MKAWAICDTDGGRLPPKPLLRYIRATKEAAQQLAAYQGADEQYYPIMEVEITIKEGKDHEHST